MIAVHDTFYIVIKLLAKYFVKIQFLYMSKHKEGIGS